MPAARFPTRCRPGRDSIHEVSLVTKPKILLVDDVNLLLELEKSFLKFSPVRVFTAHDGKEALEVVEQERPDLIFMDLNMPNMDGPTCCKTLKGNPDTAAIPVVMVTTAGRPEDEGLCRDSGCDDFITKPIDRRVFLEKGRKFLPFIDRREPRVPCTAEVIIKSGDQIMTGHIVDISIGGIYVACVQPLNEESKLTLTFVLSGREPLTIEAKGRVAWDNSREGRQKLRLPEGFGIEFISVDDKALEGIREYVEELKPKY